MSQVAQEETLSVQEPDEDLKKQQFEWRNKSAQDIVNDIKGETKNKKVQLQIDTILARVEQTCEAVAYSVEDSVRKLGLDNVHLRNVFQDVAESIRHIPYSPRVALNYATSAKIDASKVPDISSEFKQMGFEEGFRSALQGKSQQLVSDVDIDID
jgi:hypothetical protein